MTGAPVATSGRLLAPPQPLARQGWASLRAQLLDDDAQRMPSIPVPQTDDDLADLTYRLTGHRFARRATCPTHAAPFQAFADAYFARYPVTIWKGSRGLGGKTRMLSILGFVEAVTLACETSILGGSGQQSKRVLASLSACWTHDGAPRPLLDVSTTTRTELRNGAVLNTLTASQRSVRGPHPQRLRCDEVDEMRLDLLDAALGQPMPSATVNTQVVLSSTHQYADGTMTAKLREAAARGWKVYEWCWRDNLVPNGWLTEAVKDRIYDTVSRTVWDTEYDLQEPSITGRAIVTDAVERMFDPALGRYDGGENEYIECEPPQEGARYYTGADWAKDQDWTIIQTYRQDGGRLRLVAHLRTGRLSWGYMIDRFNAQARRYRSANAHDGNGIGDVIADMFMVDVLNVILSGAKRKEVLNDYIVAIENGEIEAPRIEHAYTEHKYCTLNDLYGSGHLPDTVCAGALAYHAYRVMPRPVSPVVDDFVGQSPWGERPAVPGQGTTDAVDWVD